MTAGSVIHPGALGKQAGYYWPIFSLHHELLKQVLPVLIRTHHAIAFYDHSSHDTMDDLSIQIYNDLNNMVNINDFILTL